jgi:hypothetical protein
MTHSNTDTSAVDVVTTYFDLMRAGNLQQALQCWAPDAVWHVTGQSKYARDYSPAEYFALCQQWYVAYPKYQARLGPVTALDELAFFTVNSDHGEAPGATSGMMLYRVVSGLIAEGWAIPARHADRYTF